MARKTIAERIQEEQIAVFNAVYELDRQGGDNELIEVSEMDKAWIGEILQRTFWCFNHLYTQGKSMGEAAADGKVCGDGAGDEV